jgi:hypothetical protein
METKDGVAEFLRSIRVASRLTREEGVEKSGMEDWNEESCTNQSRKNSPGWHVQVIELIMVALPIENQTMRAQIGKMLCIEIAL